jgi:penicillin-binding protein 1A
MVYKTPGLHAPGMWSPLMSGQKKSFDSEIDPVPSKKRGIRRTLLRICIFSGLLLSVTAVCFATGLYFYFSVDLPRISSLKEYRPPVVSTIYASDHQRIGEFFRERRIVVGFSEIPKVLIDAFIAAEDARFFKHKGLDILSIIRAFFKNLEAGEIVQGGSTITQQVIKSFLLTPEKSYERKIKEAILAYRIDKTFTKDEILFLYLNQIYLGHGAYGVQSAAESYFGKSAIDLNLAEAALLAGLPQAPSRYSPFRDLQKAKQRQMYVLKRMVEEGFITRQQADEAMNQPLELKSRKNLFRDLAPHYTEHVRRYIEEKYGEKALKEGGLKIYTALDIDAQQAARDEILNGLRELDKRQGYRGPLKTLDPQGIESHVKSLESTFDISAVQQGSITEAVVIGVDSEKKEALVHFGGGTGRLDIKQMHWAGKPRVDMDHRRSTVQRSAEVLSVGDVILVSFLDAPGQEKTIREVALEQEPEVQGALLCVETGTGHVKAMIGGRDFNISQFNRAVQSRRQPGSAFKPVIYSAALDKGFTPASVLLDTAVVYRTGEDDFVWKPQNYNKKFYGETMLREALANSRNVVTVKLLKKIGIDYVIKYARKLGIASNIKRDLSIALGSSGVSLLEMVQAYSVFANMGEKIAPVFVTKVEDRNGNILEEAAPGNDQVISTGTAYVMTSLLESVVKEGTGKRVQALNRPVAGKTGTTDDLCDAWFIGYTPQLITGVWVGFDDKRSLGTGETGATAASPIWLAFMKRALADEPIEGFQVPEDVVFAKIDARTGLLPVRGSKQVRFECFKEGTAPTRYTKKPEIITEAEDFFKTSM